jgi:hypothetical protein
MITSKVNKMKSVKKIISAVFLVSAMGYLGVVSAHTAKGVLGKSTSKLSATDVWKLDCGPLAKKLFLEVTDQKPKNASSLVSVLGVKGDSASVLITDINEGDSKPSTSVNFKPTNGRDIYTVIVTKSQSTKAGSQGYLVTMHCLDANNKHTVEGEEPTQVQDQ